MSTLAKALLDELAADGQLSELARMLRPHMGDLVAAESEVPAKWAGSREAAEFLGLTKNALHKLTAARAIPFEQDEVGGKLWFYLPELHAWRRGELAAPGSSANR